QNVSLSEFLLVTICVFTLLSRARGSHRSAPIRTRRNHKIARGEVEPPESGSGRCSNPPECNQSNRLPVARSCRRKACGFSGVWQMSNVINFQGDAVECLRMAERAKGSDEKSVLVDLARAWVLLGEQLRHLHDETASDVPKPSPLN